MKYRVQNNKKFLMIVLMSALVLLSVFGNDNLTADDSILIKTIRPVPNFDLREVNLDKEAKRHSQITGTVDFIGDGYIVVDDSAIKTAPGVNLSGAVKGSYVGIRLNDKGQAENIQKINNPE